MKTWLSPIICALAFLLLVLLLAHLTCSCQRREPMPLPVAVDQPGLESKREQPRTVVADMDQLLRKLRVQVVPGIGPLGGWHRPATVAEVAAIAGEHVTAEQMARIRRADAAAAAAIRQQEIEGLWLLGVYSLSVLVAFLGFVATFYFREYIFLSLPAAGLGVSFIAYFFLHAFFWLAWIIVGALGLIAVAGVWYVVRRGGIMQVVAGKAIEYAEHQKKMLPAESREIMRTFAKDEHPKGISAVIDGLRGKKG